MRFKALGLSSDWNAEGWRVIAQSRDSSEAWNCCRLTGHSCIRLHQPLTSINMTPQESSCLTSHARSLSLSSMYLGFSSRKLSNQSKVPDPATSTAQPMNFATNVTCSTCSSCTWLMRALCINPKHQSGNHPSIQPLSESYPRRIQIDLKSLALWTGDPGILLSVYRFCRN